MIKAIASPLHGIFQNCVFIFDCPFLGGCKWMIIPGFSIFSILPAADPKVYIEEVGSVMRVGA